MKATSSVLAREPVTEALDWRDVASERLAKITDLEHVLTATTARLNAMQGERHQLVQQHHAEVTSLKRQLDHLHALQLEEKLEAAMRREADLLASTSWRITRPLRALSVLLARIMR
ncbi:hypothetical protein [Dyella sp. ASV21]|jgi:hypothetical protein|uniref:hypothetical protein n=1 Tax=Dyella sp. ASV21 TaxID=2795114 RepID=UPI0018EC2B39|nr:hypothetical protein [Dyella sp. ASV21]